MALHSAVMVRLWVRTLTVGSGQCSMRVPGRLPVDEVEDLRRGVEVGLTQPRLWRSGLVGENSMRRWEGQQAASKCF